jgi:hypothetical protein
MAMEVITLIERFTFDFGKAGQLAEEAHYQAFEEVFSRVVSTLALWVPADSRMSIKSLNKSGPLDQLEQDSREIARQLYYSDADECIVDLSSNGGWVASIRIVMDPILIYFESSK